MCQLRNPVRDRTKHRNEKLWKVSTLGHAHLTVLILRSMRVEWSQFSSFQCGVHFLCWGFPDGWAKLIPGFVQMIPSFLSFRLVPSFAHIALCIYFFFLLQKRMAYFRLEVYRWVKLPLGDIYRTRNTGACIIMTYGMLHIASRTELDLHSYVRPQFSWQPWSYIGDLTREGVTHLKLR
jgi:hypothetical protein